MSPSGVPVRPSSRYGLEQRLHRAAGPLLAAVSQDLQDLDFALSLADSSGRGTRQWAHSPGTATRLRQATILTEAVRSAIRTREDAVVRGHEHVTGTPISCAAAAVIDPQAGHLLGVVALTCLGTSYSPTMPALVSRLVHEIRQQLKQAATPPAPEPQPEPADPVPAWAGLTATERRVAALVSEGLTNREVATKLTVSPHTVDYYLRRIYQKLGLRSRVQLANLATTS